MDYFYVHLVELRRPKIKLTKELNFFKIAQVRVKEAQKWRATDKGCRAAAEVCAREVGRRVDLARQKEKESSFL